MSDTTERTDHAATIRELREYIEECWDGVTPHQGEMHDALTQIVRRADALAGQLAEAEARAARLQRNWQTFEHAEGHPAAHERWQAHKRAYRDCIHHGDFLPRLEDDETGDLPSPDAPGDPMATTITPLQREAVVRDLIREARDGAQRRSTEALIAWLWSRIPDADGEGDGA